MTPVVAVLGASGGVGGVATTALRQLGGCQLRLGGRRAGPLRTLSRASDAGGARMRATSVKVDLDNEDELRAFCAGASVVLNCAGPSYRVGAKVARAALTSGARYVDAAGDDRLAAQVRQVARDHRGGLAVLSAGMMPGLTALLPRYLAGRVGAAVQHLRGYIGGRDRFTGTAAADYLATAADFGAAGAAIVNGARVVEEVSRASIHLPFLDEPVTAVPYLSAELERVATALNVTDVRWHSVFAGDRVMAVLRTADGPAAAQALQRAAELDCFGHQAYQMVVVEAKAHDRARTVVVRGAGANALTGAVAAVTTALVLRDRLAPGVHHAGEVLDPDEAIGLLGRLPAGGTLTELAGAADEVGGYTEEAI